MELVNIRELYRNQEEYLDKTVTIGGWVRSTRSSKNFGFIVVNDGTFFEPLQIGICRWLRKFCRGRKIKCRCGNHRYRKISSNPTGKTAI